MFGFIKNKYKSSSFIRNAITLVSSTVVAQALPILTAPILTRIYSPDDYGTLGIYMSVSGLFGVFATLGYSNAIMIVKDDEEAISLTTVCFYNSILIAAISLLLTIGLKNYVIVHFQAEKLAGAYLFFIPMTIFLTGVNTTLSVWANRKLKYKRLAISRIGTSLFTPILSIVLGLIYKNFFGLFAGLIGGQLIFTLFLWGQSKKEDKFRLNKLDFISVKAYYLKHRNFFLYSLPADFVNNFTNQAPVFVLSSMAGMSVVGQFNMSSRMLAVPSFLISSSIGDVFKQRASADFHQLGTCRPIFIKTFKTLLIISIPLFGLLFLFGPEIFALAFGERWRQAGSMSRVMVLMYFLRFVISPLTYVYYIKNKQFEDFLGHLLMLIIPIVGGYWFILNHNSTYENFLVFYTVGYSFIYIFYLIRSYGFTSN